MKDLISRLMGRKLTPEEGASTVPATENVNASSVVTVGARIPVGQFFWITTCIGMANNAVHGYGVRDKPRPGSADENCHVRVLEVKDDYAVVVLDRGEKKPYGASAPHGTIFLVPVAELELWPEMKAHRVRQEKARAKMRRNLGSVRV